MSAFDDERRDPLDEDPGYQPDPEAPKTDEERQRLAEEELDRVTRIAVALAAVATGLAFFAGPDLGRGVLLGSLASIVNLRFLAKAGWSLLAGRSTGAQAVVGFLGSFGVLLAAAVFVAFVQPGWMLGFGLGLALPVLVGVVWSLRGGKPR